MSDASQLSLLADHVKLSLLEKQRAISLNLPANSQDSEISRSLDALHAGLQNAEVRLANTTPTGEAKSQFSLLQQQYNDLKNQFEGLSTNATSLAAIEPNNPALSATFDNAHAAVSSTAKSVRFRDNPQAEEDANRAALMPYHDEPDEDAPDHSNLDNQQIHQYHSRVMQDQDEQLDQLSASIGRQRDLSIQIGDELDQQAELLDDVDGGVERHQTQIDRARRRLGKVARKAKDNLSLTIILTLIVILILLIVITK